MSGETTRPVALSMFPDVMPDRPTGPILRSVFQGSNADLMAAVAPLYLAGSVLDVTYGEGKWWQRFTPDPFVYHDLKVDGVDFTDLPHADGEFATVCYDPPYVPAGGESTVASVGRSFRDAFGLTAGRTAGEFDAMVLAGLGEAARVAGTYLLVKCMEFVGSAAFTDMPTIITNRCTELGLVKHDQIVHFTGSGPGGHNIFEVKRARRAHSYLLVFTRSSKPRASVEYPEREGAA